MIGDPFWVYPETSKDIQILAVFPVFCPIILRIIQQIQETVVVTVLGFQGIQVYIANMMVWKIIFIFNGMIFRGNVGFPDEYSLILLKGHFLI